ncbi:MAG: cell division protein FtsZ [Clostridia bacterium]|nr:cell division protein FtsZ [Clostridia bacterium]
MANTYGVANIKVMGIGGGGNNAVNRMILAGITSCTFIAANTDMQALNMSKAPIKIQLGASLTKGLGAGADPEMGARAAEESKDEIRQHLEDTDLLFITAGMGGGTGTGAAPVIAQMAKEMNILTIAVVTKPFEQFEGKRRMENAQKGIEELRKVVDTLLVIPNEKIQMFVPKGTTLVQAFKVADDVLRQGIQGITEIITTPALINLDFADIKTIMKNKGNAHIGIGKGKGENRTFEAVRQAVQSPLLETNIQGATGIIVYVSGGPGLTMEEVNNSVSLIRDVVDPSANIIFGMGIDEALDEEVIITVIATGFETKPDGRSKYSTMSRPMFNEPERNAQMDRMYGYAPEYNEAAATQAPQAPRQQEQVPPQFRPQNDMPTGRMDVTDSKIPPFLQRLKDKNR